MQLGRLLLLAFAGIAAVLLIAAMFVPWQSGSFLGVTIGPGLWNVQTEGFGEQGADPYSEYDSVDGTAKAMLVFSRITALVGLVAAAGVALLTWRSGDGPDRSLALASGGAALASGLAVVFFERGIQESFDSAGDFFSLTHGSNLAIAAAVLLLAGMLAARFLDGVSMQLERARAPPENQP